jgi:hypothetical protein
MIKDISALLEGLGAKTDSIVFEKIDMSLLFLLMRPASGTFTHRLLRRTLVRRKMQVRLIVPPCRSFYAA